MKIPVCVRDGSVPGTIKIGDFEFEIDLTELDKIISDARLELRDSLLTNKAMLSNALHCMSEAIFVTMTNSMRSTEEEDEENRKRWEKTGCGGYQNLDEAWEIIRKDKETRKAIQEEKELARVLAWLPVRAEREEAWEAAQKEKPCESWKGVSK